MKIEKSFTIAAPREKVWQFITSPESVAACIPGCEAVEQTGDHTYQALLRVKIGMIKAKFNVAIETIEESPPEFARYRTGGFEGGKASRLKAESKLALTALDEATTEVMYSSEISMIGRLGKFSQGMMNKVADSIGESFVQPCARRLKWAGRRNNSGGS